ncbi:hypothetical protein ACFLQZ_01060 [Acidobacteriota bacterium]
MEEIEITSWLTLDAIKKESTIIETLGDLQTGHCMAVFCIIEDDYFELCYSDSISNYMRRFEDREEFELGLEKRKEEFGEARFDDDMDIKEDDESEISDETEDDLTENLDIF